MSIEQKAENLVSALLHGKMEQVYSLSQQILDDPNVQQDATELARQVMYDDLKNHIECICEDQDDFAPHPTYFFDTNGRIKQFSFVDEFYPSTNTLKCTGSAIIAPLIFQHNVRDLTDGQTEQITYFGLLMKTSNTYWTVVDRYATDKKGNKLYVHNSPAPLFVLNEVVVNNHCVGTIHRNSKFEKYDFSEEFKLWHLYLEHLVIQHLKTKLNLSDKHPTITVVTNAMG